MPPQDAERTQNLAIADYPTDHDLVASVKETGQPAVQVYSPLTICVVLGKGSDPVIELNIAACLADNVPIFRRAGGGCAVVLDPGNIIISVGLPLPGINHTHVYFSRVSHWLIQGLEVVDVTGVGQKGKYDLTLRNRKIAGASVFRTKGLLYYTASLLVEPDMAAIERYLKHPPRAPQYRAGRAHRDFLFSLVENPAVTSTAQLLADLEAALTVESLWPSSITNHA